MKFNPRRIKVGLELTSKCNLRCGMCPLPVLRRPYEDMEWPLVVHAEREIHGMGLRLKWLHEMGEPLLYARLDDAIRLFPEASVSTNGLLLTGEIGARLLATPLKAGIDWWSLPYSREGDWRGPNPGRSCLLSRRLALVSARTGSKPGRSQIAGQLWLRRATGAGQRDANREPGVQRQICWSTRKGDIV